MKLSTLIVAAALAIPAVSSFAQSSQTPVTRAQMKSENPEWDNAQVLQAVSAKWKLMPEEERKVSYIWSSFSDKSLDKCFRRKSMPMPKFKWNNGSTTTLHTRKRRKLPAIA